MIVATQRRLHNEHRARNARFAAAALKVAPPERPTPLQMPTQRRVMAYGGSIGGHLRESHYVWRIGTKTPRGKISKLKIGEIVAFVSQEENVSVREITGQRRTRSVTLPRHICMYLAVELTGLSLPQIGRAMGDRDHTTILHAHKGMKARLAQDANLAERVFSYQKRLSA